MEIRPLSQYEFKDWDSLVDRSDSGSLFHKSYWISASSQPFLIFGCFDKGVLVGGVPLIVKEKFLLKKAGYPILTPYLDIIAVSNARNKIKRMSYLRDVIQNILCFLQKHYQIISLTLSPSFLDVVPLLQNRFNLTVKITYRIDLDQDLDAIWQGLHGSRRTDIKKAKSSGFKVSLEDDPDVLLNLIQKTYIRQNRSPKLASLAKPFVSAAIKNESGKCFITYDQNEEPYGGIFLVWDARTATYLLGGFDHQMGSNTAVVLAIWEAIRFAKEKIGAKVFDFEGSLVPQLEFFFRRFGGDLYHYHRAEWTIQSLQFLYGMRKWLR